MRTLALIGGGLALLGTMGCGRLDLSGPFQTGLTGTVTRGPITPVCQLQIPCDAPFSAKFTARFGDLVIARFRSDSLGHFTVHLLPGTYLIIPGPDAPILSPGSQTRLVTVGPDSLTTVQLTFDTGIR